MIALALFACTTDRRTSHPPADGQTADSAVGRELPGTTVAPPLRDTYLSLAYDFDGGFVKFPSAGLELFLNVAKSPNQEGYIPVLDQGESLDDCTVYGPFQEGKPGLGPADAGVFHLEAGDNSYDLRFGDDYAYGYPGYGPHLTSEQEAAPPPWGEAVSVSLPGSEDAPGFAFDRIGWFPLGPLEISAPAVDAVLTSETATLRWKGLGDAPIRMDLSVTWGATPDTRDVICVVADDGEFTIPQHVWDQVPKLAKALIGVEARRGGETRYVEVEPDRWAAFNIYSRIGHRFWVQN